MVLANVPMTTEAKTKVSITVTNKSTGKKVGKKLTLKTGQKVQLKVKYGKKTVTKRAKYKTSAKKVVVVSKKGKLTAKTTGTCTVKVTYKKAVKKIKVTVKAPMTNTEETTEEATTEETKKSKNATPEEIAQFEETLKLDGDPHPECEHEWSPNLYDPDGQRDSNKFILCSLYCMKCSTYARTAPITAPEVLNMYRDEEIHLQDELTRTIVGYYNETSVYPKHKHQYRYEYCIWKYWGTYKFFGTEVCAICGNPS